MELCEEPVCLSFTFGELNLPVDGVSNLLLDNCALKSFFNYLIIQLKYSIQCVGIYFSYDLIFFKHYLIIF